MRRAVLIAGLLGLLLGVLAISASSAPPKPGVGLVLAQTTHLSSAQILALHDTPVEIAPAPGAGKVLQIVGVSAKLKVGTTPYTLASGQPGYDYAGFAPSSNRGTTMAPLTLTAIANHVDSDIGVWSVYDARTAIENEAVMFFVTNANPTAGDGTLDVTVWYMVDDLPA